MSTKHESGHVVFLTNFGRMTMVCDEAGDSFCPPDSAISVVNLKAKDEKQKIAFAEFLEAAGVYKIKVDILQHALAPIGKKITRVVNVAKACDVTKEFIETVKATGKKIEGVRISAKIIAPPPDDSTPPTDEQIVQISAAHTGIDQKIGHIEELIQILKNESNFLPNEPELKIVALEADVTELKDKRDASDSAKFHLDAKRIARDKEMYTGEGNGADLSVKVKAYFKGAFGGNSKEYHNVAKLEFKKIVK